MSRHGAVVEWRRAEGEAFTDQRYSRRHVWRFDGGAEVPASASPHNVRLPFSDPAAVDPEEAMVAALSSCHMLWFLSLAAARGYQVDHYRDEAQGHMEPDAEGQLWLARIALFPHARFSGDRRPNAQELDDLHEAAHRACFIARSVRSALSCTPSFD